MQFTQEKKTQEHSGEGAVYVFPANAAVPGQNHGCWRVDAARAWCSAGNQNALNFLSSAFSVRCISCITLRERYILDELLVSNAA